VIQKRNIETYGKMWAKEIASTFVGAISLVKIKKYKKYCFSKNNNI
jgi:hypothetical protein